MCVYFMSGYTKRVCYVPICFLFSQQEILEEVVRELHKVKDEIIDGKFC